MPGNIQQRDDAGFGSRLATAVDEQIPGVETSLQKSWLTMAKALTLEWFTFHPANQCPRCGVIDGSVQRRRQSTAYVDDQQNFVLACETCYEEVESYWEERWQDYYRDIL